MKRVLIIMIASISLLAVNFQARAQDDTGPLSYGVNAAYTYTTLFKDRSLPYEFRGGYAGGLFVEYEFQSNLSASASVSFASVGANNVEPLDIYYEGETIFNTPVMTLSNTDVRLNSFDIPVMLHFSPNEFLRFSLGSGYSYIPFVSGINTFTVETDLIAGEQTVERLDPGVEPRIGNHDVYVIAGAGLKFQVSIFKLYGDVLYRYGVMDLNNRRLPLGTDFNLFSTGLYLNLRVGATFQDLTSSLF